MPNDRNGGMRDASRTGGQVMAVRVYVGQH